MRRGVRYILNLGGESEGKEQSRIGLGRAFVTNVSSCSARHYELKE